MGMSLALDRLMNAPAEFLDFMVMSLPEVYENLGLPAE